MSLQILDDQCGRRNRDRSAECLAQPGKFGFPTGRGQRRLHRDVAGAVAQAAEALGFSLAFPFRQPRWIQRIRGDLVDGIVGEYKGRGLLNLAKGAGLVTPLFNLGKKQSRSQGDARAAEKPIARFGVALLCPTSIGVSRRPRIRRESIHQRDNLQGGSQLIQARRTFHLNLDRLPRQYIDVVIRVRRIQVAQ